MAPQPPGSDGGVDVVLAGHRGLASRQHPILENHSDGLIVRFTCKNLLRVDDDAAELQRTWDRRFDEGHIAVEYQRNDILVWDDWRLLHDRNSFTDRDRHLRRVQIAAATVM